MLLQRLIHRSPRAQHDGRIRTGHSLGDRKHAMGIMAADVRETTIRNTAIGILVPIRRNPTRTVVLSPAGARFTICSPARVALRTDAHAIADSDARPGVVADSDGRADDFVPEADGIERWALDGAQFGELCVIYIYTYLSLSLSFSTGE